MKPWLKILISLLLTGALIESLHLIYGKEIVIPNILFWVVTLVFYVLIGLANWIKIQWKNSRIKNDNILDQE